MTDPKSVREEIEALCPCLRRQTHADTIFHPCDDRACRCFYLGDGVDGCLWPGHALALSLAAQVEALTKERDEARRERDERVLPGKLDALYRVIESAEDEVKRLKEQVVDLRKQRDDAEELLVLRTKERDELERDWKESGV